MMRRFGSEAWWIRTGAWGSALGVALVARAAEVIGPASAPIAALHATAAVPSPANSPDSECADGAWCAPIPLVARTAVQKGSTRGAEAVIDRYGCDPSIDEAGGEVVYELSLTGDTWVRASVTGEKGSDPDLHVLTGVGPTGCRLRGDARLSVVLPAGHHFLVVDAWEAREGAFELSVQQTPLPGGKCATVARDQVMHWPACADGMDCAESGEGVRARLPAAGPVAREAHLRTVADADWPTSGDSSIDTHFRASQRASGYAMVRREPWAPSPTGDGWAKPSYGKPLPVVAETWYVNMFWREKPAPGEKMILWSPKTGRAVVGAAGYETGPRANSALGGASEEVHHALGTRHLDEVVMGFAADQSLPYGPVSCD